MPMLKASFARYARDSGKIADAEVVAQNFAEHGAKISSEREVASFVKLAFA